MSEVTDAVSVVVSEETGQVTLAVGGMIVRDIKEESLISKLFEELTQQNGQTSKTKSKFPFRKKKEGEANG